MIPHRVAWLAIALALLHPVTAQARNPGIAQGDPSASSVDVPPGYLLPDFWIGRLVAPDQPLLDAAQITVRNAALVRSDSSLHDLRSLPQSLGRAQVANWVARVSHAPATPLSDAGGQPLTGARLEAIVANTAVDAIPAQQHVRYGLAIRRARLRSFPTTLRVFSDGDPDIDRFQESALLPMTPVVIVHESRDRAWWLVVTPDYAAWVDKSAIAEGSRSQVLGIMDRHPLRIVTGAAVRTTMTPDEPRVSDLQLDMGVRLPLAEATSGDVVNGQRSGMAWTVLLPVRDAAGRLNLQPALVPRTADTAPGPLPLTRATILRQAFKFLGERYGWGGDYGTRDCSGFVAAVFASMGVDLPRNTGDQAHNPVFDRTHVVDATERAAVVRDLQVGDLVYIPGHVMLVVGRIGDEPYVIHDIHDGKILGADGQLRSLHFNGVVVTPLRPLRLDATHGFVDAITDVVHMAGSHPPGTVRQ
jgi:cell wall-associated NlpC family hydrolase